MSQQRPRRFKGGMRSKEKISQTSVGKKTRKNTFIVLRG
jgi:hypothetical protein